LKILKNIHVVFAKRQRELVPILAYVWSITCSWVHKGYSRILGKLKSNDEFHCTRCFKGSRDPFVERNVKQGCVILCSVYSCFSL
jgi:hypothetical protein